MERFLHFSISIRAMALVDCLPKKNSCRSNMLPMVLGTSSFLGYTISFIGGGFEDPVKIENKILIWKKKRGNTKNNENTNVKI
jgi:hypothetical protein